MKKQLLIRNILQVRFSLLTAFMLIILLFISGCTHVTLKITDAQQPVMLGNLQQIGGGNIAHDAFESKVTTFSRESAWGILFPFWEELPVNKANGDPYYPPEMSPRQIVIHDLAFETSQGGLVFIYVPVIGSVCKIELRSSIFAEEDQSGFNHEQK